MSMVQQGSYHRYRASWWAQWGPKDAPKSTKGHFQGSYERYKALSARKELTGPHWVLQGRPEIWTWPGSGTGTWLWSGSWDQGPGPGLRPGNGRSPGPLENDRQCERATVGESSAAGEGGRSEERQPEGDRRQQAGAADDFALSNLKQVLTTGEWWE